MRRGAQRRFDKLTHDTGCSIRVFGEANWNSLLLGQLRLIQVRTSTTLEVSGEIRFSIRDGAVHDGRC